MKSNARFTLTLFAILSWIALPLAWSCDICSVYSRPHEDQTKPGFYTGMFVQSTQYDTLQLDGRDLSESTGESLESQHLQTVLGYRINQRWRLQGNIPMTKRTFTRNHDGQREAGSVSGLGDTTVLAEVRVLDQTKSRSGDGWLLSLFGGVELPTGNSDELAEELEHHHAEAKRSFQQGDELHLEAASAIHGHELALGSGSYDLLFGTAASYSRARFDLKTRLQYVKRTEGDFDYRFGDELTLALAPSFDVLRSGDHTLRLGLSVIGEGKQQDRLQGESVEATDAALWYAGPTLEYSLTRRVHAEFNLDFPVSTQGDGLQLFPDRRLRFAAIAQF